MLVHGLDPKRTTLPELAAWLAAVERREDEDDGQHGQHQQHHAHQPQPNPDMR